MTVIIDTNVLISGIFFAGAPGRVVDASLSGEIGLVVSPEILLEYRRVATEIGVRFPDVEVSQILDLLTVQSLICDADPMPNQVCDDPDDDKFIACALASGTTVIVTGDRALLELDGFRGLSILRPRRFVDDHLRWRVREPAADIARGSWGPPDRAVVTCGAYQFGEA